MTISSNSPTQNDCVNQAICKILKQEDAGQQSLFLLEGPTRSGKTDVLNQLLEEFKARDKTVTMGAWTHWSAAKLKQGRTICSIFCLDFKNEYRAKIPEIRYSDLQTTDVFLLDGVNLLPLEAFQSLATALGHDVGNPFGGKTIILAADFGKIGPVDGASINGSNILNTFERIDLKPKDGDQWGVELADIRDKKKVEWNKFKKINSYQELLQNFWPDKEVIDNSIILTAQNEDVDRLNNKFLDLLDGNNVSIELKADNQSKSLKLKVGAILKLTKPCEHLRDTRIILEQVTKDHLVCKILETSHFGEIIRIPKITYSNERCPKLPVQVDFAGTIHGNSEKIFDRIVLVRKDGFIHDDLVYTALSRCKKMEEVQILDLVEYDFDTNVS